jgi:hypothetical protein
MAIKGGAACLTDTSPISHLCTTNMSNGLSLPASTFSFQYPTMDHEETPTTRTTNDHQYDNQVVLFGAGQQFVRANPSLTDFDPLGVNIAMCNVWYEPEAIYCNNTWWETFQDNRSEVSELGSSNVPGQPHAPVNWAGPKLPFFVLTRTTYPPDP